jgi:hypothetical protein
MRVIVYDEAGDIAFSYNTRGNTLSLCPGRLENAQVVEALQDAVLFIMDGPVPPAENRSFRRHEMDDDDGDGDRGRLEVEPGSLVPFV